MTEKMKHVVRLLAPLGALVVSVSAFADSFGLGSDNGEFGRWQLIGMLGAWCLIAVGLVMREQETRVERNRDRVVPLRWGNAAAVLVAAVVLLVVVGRPSPVPGWKCSKAGPDGRATCTLVHGGCYYEREFDLGDPDSWDLNYPDISCDL